MSEENETLTFRAPPELFDRLDAWVDEANDDLAYGTVTRSDGLRYLLGRALELSSVDEFARLDRLERFAETVDEVLHTDWREWGDVRTDAYRARLEEIEAAFAEVDDA